MTLLFILLAPLIAVVAARWTWRQHLRALHLLGPAFAARMGASTPPSSATVVSVLVVDDAVLVGLRPAPRSTNGIRAAASGPVSTVVLSLRGDRGRSVARLDRWEASGASILVWASGSDKTIGLCQLHTGQKVRLPMVGRKIDHGSAHPAGHLSPSDPLS